MSYFLKRGENEKKKIPLITDGRVNTFIANLFPTTFIANLFPLLSF